MRFQTQAKVVAWIEIVFSAVFLCFLAFFMLVLILNPKEFQDELEKQEPMMDGEMREQYNSILHGSTFGKILVLTPYVAYLIAEIVLGVMLLRAADALDYKKLRLWYVVTITATSVLGILMLSVLFMTYRGVSLVHVISVGSFLFTLYSLWVVRSLRSEIKGSRLPTVHSPPPVYQASFTNSNYYAGPPSSDKEFLKI